MIRIKHQEIIDDDYKFEKEDLLKVQKALYLYRDIFCTLDECGNIWQQYSWELSASWLFLPKELKDIPKYIESAYGFKSYSYWCSLE